MNYNPYAAPQNGPPGGPPPDMPGNPASTRQPWELGEVLSAAWVFYQANWLVLILALVVSFVLMGGPMMAGMFAVMPAMGTRVEPKQMIPALVGVVGLVALIWPFLQVGIIRIGLAVARGGTPSVGLLFTGGGRYLPMLALLLLLQAPGIAMSGIELAIGTLHNPILGGLVSMVGLVVRIGLAVLQGLGLSYAAYIVSDSNAGPIDALKQSWALAAPERGKVFLTLLVFVLIEVASMMCCILPAFVGYPVAMIAQAIVFTRMTGTGVAAAARPVQGGGYGGPPQGGGGYGGPPQGGGYGPPPGGGYGPPPGGGYGQ